MNELLKKTVVASAILGMVACSSDDAPAEAPAPVIKTSTTQANAEITLTSIVINGSINIDQPENLSAYGVAWDTQPNPDITGNTTDESASEANFSAYKAQEAGINFNSEITNLTPNETYYFRVYATTADGTTYGEQIELNTLSLAGTTWDFRFNHSEIAFWNADVTFYEDGTAFYTEPAIPEIYDMTGTWSLEGTELTYDLDGDPTGEAYFLTGSVKGKQMEGTYTWGPDDLPWEAVMYEE